jgi:DNA-directed RNA polymerase specialized sigma24 family protein
MTFEEFAAERMPGVPRFAAVLAGDRPTAEDLAQEVLIRAYSRWDRIGCLDRRRPGDTAALAHRDRQRVRRFPGTTALNAVPGFLWNP